MFEELLRTYFDQHTFRPGQLEAIQGIEVAHRDTLVVLPTSTGKTLIFQFLTILNRQRCSTAVTVVVSPLIALMVDHVASWNRLFVCAPDGTMARRGSDPAGPPVAVLLGTAQQDAGVEPDAIRGTYPVVYLSPEKLPFLSHRIHAHVHLLVIDECHCISEHGNSFRPAYRNVRACFPGVRTLALTATAPPDIADDILANLALNDPLLVRLSMYRPNLQPYVTAINRQKLL